MKKLLDITIVLDRSGSMQDLTNETINGFNEFIHSQRNEAFDAQVTLIQFDHEFKVDYEALPIDQVKRLTRRTYVPRGMTALLDAIGRSIKMTKVRQKSIHNEKPDKTIFVIITDGYENSSKKYSRETIFKKIRKMEDKRGWDFVYLGANQDAIQEASNYGITRDKAMTFAADDKGVKEMFHSVSHNVAASMLLDDSFHFIDAQRKKQKRNN